MTTPIRAESGHIVGAVEGGVFVKHALEELHILRKPRGWAFDVASLDAAEAAGAVTIRVDATDTGRVYVASLGDIWRYGIPVSRGHGEQVCLAVERWHTAGDDIGTQPRLW